MFTPKKYIRIVSNLFIYDAYTLSCDRLSPFHVLISCLLLDIFLSIITLLEIPYHFTWYCWN